MSTSCRAIPASGISVAVACFVILSFLPLTSTQPAGTSYGTVLRPVPLITSQGLTTTRVGLATARLYYNGGALLTGPITVSYVYYGDWSQGGQNIVRNFVNSLTNPSSADQSTPSVQNWWNIVRHYTQGSGGPYVSGSVISGAEVSDTGSYGTSISDNTVAQILYSQFSSGRLSPDPNTVYLVLTGPEVSVGSSSGGFCSSYCGWHTQGQYQGTRINYGFIGNAVSQCPNSCNVFTRNGMQVSPNGNIGVDGMIPVIAHELSEVATDPYPGQGYTTGGSNALEIADLCNSFYGQPILQSSSYPSYKYNVAGINNYKFLLEGLVQFETTQCVGQDVSPDGAVGGVVPATSPPPPSPQVVFLSPSPPPLTSLPSPPPPTSAVRLSPPPPASKGTCQVRWSNGFKCSGCGSRLGCLCTRSGQCVSFCSYFGFCTKCYGNLFCYCSRNC